MLAWHYSSDLFTPFYWGPLSGVHRAPQCGESRTPGSASSLGKRTGSNPDCCVDADPAGHPFCLSTWEGRRLVDSSPDGHVG